MPGINFSYKHRAVPATAVLPQGPFNLYAHFIGPGPVTSFNPVPRYPSIHPTSFIGPFSSVIGDVVISPNVFVAPGAAIRADEGMPFFIGSNSNIQDGVILHGLRNERIQVGSREYSIYIGSGVVCAHGCIIHGPCYVGDNVFVGFNAIIFNAVVERGAYVSSGSVVTNGVRIKSESFVPPGAAIDTQEKADSLGPVPADREEFVREVQRVNKEFPQAYSLYFGKKRCSCGLCCDAC